jgi:cell division protein FtsQ
VLRHEPLVRIINEHGENYYISTDGNILPFSTKYTPRVLVASGNIANTYKAIKDSALNIHQKSTDKTAILASIHNLAMALSEHEYLNKYIEQIYINRQNEIELVPADGDHFVILGNTENVQKKFSNLMAFYRAGKPKMEQGFQSLNLKYTNQVICKK